MSTTGSPTTQSGTSEPEAEKYQIPQRYEPLRQDTRKLSAAIEGSLLNINTLYRASGPNKSFDDQLQAIKEHLQVEAKREGSLRKYDPDLFAIRAHFCRTDLVRGDELLLIYAAQYSLEAKALLESGDTIAAIQSLDSSDRLVSQYPDAFQYLQAVRQAGRGNARLGGRATAAPNQSAKNYVAKLLEDKAPITGWKSKAAAAQAIEEEVWDFIVSNNLNLSHTNLLILLNNWLSQDLTLRAAYQANSAHHTRA